MSSGVSLPSKCQWSCLGEFSLPYYSLYFSNFIPYPITALPTDPALVFKPTLPFCAHITPDEDRSGSKACVYGPFLMLLLAVLRPYGRLYALDLMLFGCFTTS